MVQKMVERIIKRQVENSTIPEDEVSIYRYGYFLLLEVLFNIIVSLVIGMVFRDVLTVVLFLGIYIPIRTYSGGWHASSLWKCSVISGFIVAGSELAVMFLPQYVPVPVYIFAALLCMSVVFILSPADSDAKPLNEGEKRTCRRKTGIILAVHLAILSVSAICGIYKLTAVTVYAYAAHTIMLIAGKIK